MKPAPPWIRPARAWSLNGWVLEVECPPVLDLVPLLMSPTVYLVLSTLVHPEDRQWVAERIIPYTDIDDVPDDDGVLLPLPDIDDELLGRIADALVWTWCGVPRWFAERIWEEAVANWVSLEGDLTRRGVDVSALPALRATRLVWSTLAQWHAQDKDKGNGWRARLEAPPPPPRPSSRRAKPSMSQDKADSDAFLSMLGTGAAARRAR